jgi:hypothetical protein
VLTGLLAGCAVAPATRIVIPPSLPAKERIETAVCSVDLYGDSIMHGGYGGHSRLDEPPAATLKRLRPRYAVQDYSRNGETATQRARTFESERRTGHFVVIAHGINDSIQRLPLEASLRPMIEIVRREGREVILTGLSRQSASIPGRASTDHAIRRLASEMHVPFADWGAVRYRPDEMADVLHPAKQYSDRLVQSIVEVLDQLAPECAGRTSD